jgi:hypothetical protein
MHFERINPLTQEPASKATALEARKDDFVHAMMTEVGATNPWRREIRAKARRHWGGDENPLVDLPPMIGAAALENRDKRVSFHARG